MCWQDNHVGSFIDPLAAAMAYDKAVKKFNANWATDPATKLNFPPGADVAYRFGPGLEVASLADLASASGVAAGSPLKSGSSASSRPGSVAPMAGRGSTSSIGLGRHQPFLALGHSKTGAAVGAAACGYAGACDAVPGPEGDGVAAPGLAEAAAAVLCKECRERESVVALVPCGHVCVCETCAAKFGAGGSGGGPPGQARCCPICQGEVVECLRIFLS